jgi:hypothetical protein
VVYERYYGSFCDIICKLMDRPFKSDLLLDMWSRLAQYTKININYEQMLQFQRVFFVGQFFFIYCHFRCYFRLLKSLFNKIVAENSCVVEISNLISRYVSLPYSWFYRISFLFNLINSSTHLKNCLFYL